MKGRNFRTVLRKIESLLDEGMKNKLCEASSYWAPESSWNQLSYWVNKNVPASSKIQNSVKIYATLCGCTDAEMLRAFHRDGV